MNGLKECAACNRKRVPEGGIETSNGRWLCATCWINQLMKAPRK